MGLDIASPQSKGVWQGSFLSNEPCQMYNAHAYPFTDIERLFSVHGDIRRTERNRYLPENSEKVLFCRENLPRVDFKY